MIYVYNPTKSPQHYGANVVIPPGYSALPEETVRAVIESGVPVIPENDPRFVSPWLRYEGQSPDKDERK